MNVSSKKFIGLPVNAKVLGLSKGFDESELVDAKCLLINMPIREQARANNAPLGLCLLASRLKEFKVEVDILDLNSYRVMDEVAKQKKLENGRILSELEAENKIRGFTDQSDYDLIALSGLITTLKWQKNVLNILQKLVRTSKSNRHSSFYIWNFKLLFLSASFVYM